MRTLIKNGRVVNANDTALADVLIEDERIVRVAPRLDEPHDHIVDATDRLVIPGGIDAHTHLDMPLDEDLTTSDDFATGTKAAAIGGTTCVVDYAVQERGGSILAALDAWKRRADGRAVVDYGFHMIVSDPSPAFEAEVPELVAAGVTSLKLFMAYPGRLMLDDGQIARVMALAKAQGALVCVHAEDGPAIDALVQQARAQGDRTPRYHAVTRPPRTEADAVRRVIGLARETGCAVMIVHVSAGDAVDEIGSGRRAGARVYGETCPQYLLLSDDLYNEPEFGGAKYVMSPPLRERGHDVRLWQGLVRAELDTVATDHCPFWLRDKARGTDDFTLIPNGAPGIEHRMTLLFDAGVRGGRMSANRWVELTSTAPARIFGLPRKGAVVPGADADIVVWHPEARWTITASTHHMQVDYNLYEGREVTGFAETVFSRGALVVDRGEFVGTPGAGRFVARHTPT